MVDRIDRTRLKVVAVPEDQISYAAGRLEGRRPIRIPARLQTGEGSGRVQDL